MTRRTLRPRPFDNKKKLTIIHDAAGLDLTSATVVSSIANKSAELEKNNDKVVKVAAKNGETMVPVPGFTSAAHYEQLYPNDFVGESDLNVEYLSNGRTLLPGETGPVEYAADIPDENWLSTTINTEGQDRLSIECFEKMIWRLEMSNSMMTQYLLRKSGASSTERKAKSTTYTMQHLTKRAAVKLLSKHEGIDMEVIELVYEYWIQKRQSLRMPLLRTLQPKTAANDRHPDHTFREREKIKRPNTRRRRHVSRGDNVDEKLIEIKDEIGHVCNIFKLMINRESLKAHDVNVYIAEKKMLFDQLACHDQNKTSQLHKIRKEQANQEEYLKKDDAEYRAKKNRFLLQNVFAGHVRKMLACTKGSEGESLDHEEILSRRLKRSQRRRKKISSFLVQERNWQKWRDKTWMQKMFLMLKKRGINGETVRSQQQKKIWKKWEKFIKLTRDERIRQFNDHTSKKKIPPTGSKASKQRKPKVKEGHDADNGVGRGQGKKTVKRPGVKVEEKASRQVEDEPHVEALSAHEVSKETLKWALEQGIGPPLQDTKQSKEITIPQAFVAPQLGFSCLPPRLKEMYNEAEKDAMESPLCIINKNEELKTRRQRILHLMNEQNLSRSEAIGLENKESKVKRELRRQHEKRSKIRKSLRSYYSTSSLNLKAQQRSQDVVKKLSQKLTLPEVSTKDELESQDLDYKEIEDTIGEIKNRKKRLKLCKRKIYELKKKMVETSSEEQLSQYSKALHHWLLYFWKLKFHKSPFHCIESPLSESNNKEDKLTEENKARTKKIQLMRRVGQKFVIDIRNGQQRKEIKLKPGSNLQLTPFKEDQLDFSHIKDSLKDLSDFQTTAKEDLTPDGASEGSRKMMKTSSAPSLVMNEDSCKKTPRKISVALDTSRRLIKGKGVSRSTLCKRHKLRRMILNPLLTSSLTKMQIPESKLRKIEAMKELEKDIPRPQLKRPLFGHAFKLSRSERKEKSKKKEKFLNGVPEEVMSSGLARIGRGNRVWIDQVDPLTLDKLNPTSFKSQNPTFHQLPIMQRILESDLYKKKLFKKCSEVEKRTKKEEEEEEMKKATVLQESQAEMFRRQENFLPHTYIQTSPSFSGKDSKKSRQRVRREEDCLKEAQKLQGITMELGLKLPIEQIYRGMNTKSGDVESSETGVDFKECFQEMDELVKAAQPPGPSFRRVDESGFIRKKRKLERSTLVKSETDLESVGWNSAGKNPSKRAASSRGRLPGRPTKKNSLPKVKTENAEATLRNFERLILSAPRKPRSNLDTMSTAMPSQELEKEDKKGPATRSQSQSIITTTTTTASNV